MSVVNDMLNDLQKTQQKSIAFDYIQPQKVKNKALTYVSFILLFSTIAVFFIFNNKTTKNFNTPKEVKKTITHPVTPKTTATNNITHESTLKKETKSDIEKTSKLVIKTIEKSSLKPLIESTTIQEKKLTHTEEKKSNKKQNKTTSIIKKNSRKSESSKRLAAIINQWNRYSFKKNARDIKAVLYSYPDLPEPWLISLNFLKNNNKNQPSDLYQQLLTQSLANFPNKKQFLIHSAKNQFNSGNYEKTLSQLNKINPNERNLMTYQLAGLAFQKLGNHQQAIIEYKKLLMLNPSRGDINMALGISYEAIDQLSEASSHFALALKDRKLSEIQKQFIRQQLVAHNG